MNCGILACPSAWQPLLPAGISRLGEARGAFEEAWDLLTLTPHGCACLKQGTLRCRILLLPGDCAVPRGVETVISYGLSPRDSLTLSSLSQPVLCIQRTLPCPDGRTIEPQEIPLPNDLKGTAETLLPLLGLRLLCLPDTPFVW